MFLFFFALVVADFPKFFRRFESEDPKFEDPKLVGPWVWNWGFQWKG